MNFFAVLQLRTWEAQRAQRYLASLLMGHRKESPKDFGACNRYRNSTTHQDRGAPELHHYTIYSGIGISDEG